MSTFKHIFQTFINSKDGIVTYAKQIFDTQLNKNQEEINKNKLDKPSGGKDGQVLTKQGDKIVWTSLPVLLDDNKLSIKYLTIEGDNEEKIILLKSSSGRLDLFKVPGGYSAIKISGTKVGDIVIDVNDLINFKNKVRLATDIEFQNAGTSSVTFNAQDSLKYKSDSIKTKDEKYAILYVDQSENEGNGPMVKILDSIVIDGDGVIDIPKKTTIYNKTLRFELTDELIKIAFSSDKNIYIDKDGIKFNGNINAADNWTNNPTYQALIAEETWGDLQTEIFNTTDIIKILGNIANKIKTLKDTIDSSSNIKSNITWDVSSIDEQTFIEALSAEQLSAIGMSIEQFEELYNHSANLTIINSDETNNLTFKNIPYHSAQNTSGNITYQIITIELYVMGIKITIVFSLNKSTNTISFASVS